MNQLLESFNSVLPLMQSEAWEEKVKNDLAGITDVTCWYSDDLGFELVIMKYRFQNAVEFHFATLDEHGFLDYQEGEHVLPPGSMARIVGTISSMIIDYIKRKTTPVRIVARNQKMKSIYRNAVKYLATQNSVPILIKDGDRPFIGADRKSHPFWFVFKQDTRSMQIECFLPTGYSEL